MNRNSWLRIGICAAFAFPMYFVGRDGLVGPALSGYIVAIVAYWCIQALTAFRHPFNGVLVVGLLVILYALVTPALAKAHAHSLAAFIFGQSV